MKIPSFLTVLTAGSLSTTTFFTTASSAQDIHPRPGQSSFQYRRGLQPRTHAQREKLHKGVFQQILDHEHPDNGTFDQHYWVSDEHWGGPGSPIFMINAGEISGEESLGWMDNDTLPSLYAQTFKGAVILFEHRYFGESAPFDVLTAETLQLLNIRQSIADQTNFAKNVKLEFAGNDSVNADKAPWVLMGGSYPGALTAWTSRLDPGVFAAYHASSAVVQAIDDFWTYFEPIEAALPRGCADNVKRVVKHVDGILSYGTNDEIQDLKDSFGLGKLNETGDFASQVAYPLLQWQTNPSLVYEFCEKLDKSTAEEDKRIASRGDNSDGHSGSGKTLEAYAGFINSSAAAQCAETDSCITYGERARQQADRPHDFSGARAWLWLVCNEPLRWWQTGPPENESDSGAIVSRHLRPDYYEHMCEVHFPETGGYRPGTSSGKTAKDVNAYTGGWDAQFDKVMFCDGEFDPWKSATMASPRRPGGPRNSTGDMPMFEMKGGNHVPDFEVQRGNKDYEDVVKAEIEVMGRWLKEWKPRQAWADQDGDGDSRESDAQGDAHVGDDQGIAKPRDSRAVSVRVDPILTWLAVLVLAVASV